MRSLSHPFEEAAERIAREMSQQRGQAAIEAFSDAEKERPSSKSAWRASRTCRGTEE